MGDGIDFVNPKSFVIVHYFFNNDFVVDVHVFGELRYRCIAKKLQDKIFCRNVCNSFHILIPSLI